MRVFEQVCGLCVDLKRLVFIERVEIDELSHNRSVYQTTTGDSRRCGTRSPSPGPLQVAAWSTASCDECVLPPRIDRPPRQDSTCRMLIEPQPAGSMARVFPEVHDLLNQRPAFIADRPGYSPPLPAACSNAQRRGDARSGGPARTGHGRAPQRRACPTTRVDLVAGQPQAPAWTSPHPVHTFTHIPGSRAGPDIDGVPDNPVGDDSRPVSSAPGGRPSTMGSP